MNINKYRKYNTRVTDKEFKTNDKELADLLMRKLGYVKPPRGTTFPQPLWDIQFERAVRGNTLSGLRQDVLTQDGEVKPHVLEDIREKAIKLAIFSTNSRWKSWLKTHEWDGGGSIPDEFYEWLGDVGEYVNESKIEDSETVGEPYCYWIYNNKTIIIQDEDFHPIEFIDFSTEDLDDEIAALEEKYPQIFKVS